MRRRELFWGCVLIIAGLLFLLGNLFHIDVGDFLWPLFLIALGGRILWRALRGANVIAGETLVIPLEDADEARIKVRYGAGQLFIHGDAGVGELLNGTFSGGLEREIHREGQRLHVVLRSPRGEWPWTPGARDWAVGLNDAIPLSLDVEVGASDTCLDLTGLRVTELCLRAGASSTEVRLPAHAGHTRASIKAGASSLSLLIPKGVAAHIQAKGGLAAITVDRARFPQAGGIYRSPDFETAENRVEIEVETGVGSVDIR